jgi:hypothetical protein
MGINIANTSRSLPEKLMIYTEDKPVNVIVSGVGPRGREGPPGLPGGAGYVIPVLTTIDANKAVTVEY